MKIIVLDDDPSILILVKTILEKDGHKVITLIKPDISTRAIDREQPDLIITDYDFKNSKVNGIHVATYLKGKGFC
jgi:DNA-binding response OmpR family regulator